MTRRRPLCRGPPARRAEGVRFRRPMAAFRLRLPNLYRPLHAFLEDVVPVRPGRAVLSDDLDAGMRDGLGREGCRTDGHAEGNCCGQPGQPVLPVRAHDVSFRGRLGALENLALASSAVRPNDRAGAGPPLRGACARLVPVASAARVSRRHGKAAPRPPGRTSQAGPSCLTVSWTITGGFVSVNETVRVRRAPCCSAVSRPDRVTRHGCGLLRAGPFPRRGFPDGPVLCGLRRCLRCPRVPWPARSG